MSYGKKLFRNALILALGYFASNFMVYNKFNWIEFKPLVAFVLIYLASELAFKYNLSTARNKKGETFIF